jgi:predicted nuclease of predicted toxin-antitoxin system
LVGRADAQTVEIMAWAKANGYMALTHAPDFSDILAARGGDKPGVA